MHRWQLSQCLQKGYLRTRETLLKDLALAAHFIFITAKARIFGHFFSVVKSMRALLHGILMLVDMVIGIPSLMAHDLDNKIREERCRYLVAELICRVWRELSHFYFSRRNFLIIFSSPRTARVRRLFRHIMRTRATAIASSNNGKVRC